MREMLFLIAPEIFITFIACFVLLIGVVFKNYYRNINYYVVLLSLIGISIITMNIMPLASQTIFDNAFIVDRFACHLKLVIYILMAGIYIYARKYMQQRNFAENEFYALSLFSMLGMMLLISCGNYLTLYIGLELLVLPIYAMIVFIPNHGKYIEAAMKYFIIGSLGAGLLLFGISFIFGATGTIDFNILTIDSNLIPVLLLGIVFIIVGIALEFGAVPFHLWLPDVYEGSPTVVTMIISTIPKIAVFALIYRLLTISFTNISASYQQLFMIMALMSIAIGNILAIVQTNIKRMLAYSTIGHVGFILLGLFVAPQEGYVATIFYTIVYTFMALAAFAMIISLANNGFEADSVTDFRGLNKKNPWLAFIMLLIMLSLAGVPPLLGFYAKFLVLQTVIAAGYTWIAIIALIFTVIGAFYYLRVIYLMYFEAPELELNDANGISVIARSLLSMHGLSLLLLGIFPATVIYYCVAMLS